MTTKKTAFISDFDGTITKEDFFQMAADRLLCKEALEPWEEYHAGNLSHLAALNRIFAGIHISLKEMKAFISSIRVDRAFFGVAALCKMRGIPFAICSAGTEYYVKKRIGKYLKKYGIALYSNGGVYSPAEGLRLIAPPRGSPFYDADAGISKAALVESFNKKDFFTVYAGDGRPDIKAARKAGAVFARGLLLELCRKENINVFELKTFKDIKEYLGARCDGK
jgi:2,3-diketo-5-methylthio-1-phosphopentane phosphatase